MAYRDLRDWITALDRAGELRRVRAEVDPILEITEITDRVSKSGRGTAQAGGPALLFENVKGHAGVPLLINQFGSARRMYRMQVYDAATAGMPWQRQKIGAEHYRQALRAAASAGENRVAQPGENRVAQPPSAVSGDDRVARTPSSASSAAVDIMARS